MMVSIVQLGKRRYLAGMRWSSFESKPTRAELREDAKRLGDAAWACVRMGEDAIQAGFCEPVTGMKRPAKLFSLAAMVADSRRQPWLGVYRIADGLWWYIAVRDGHAILPDGDIIGGEAEIRAARDRHSGYTDWEYVDGNIADLLNIVENNAPWIKPALIRTLHGNGIPVVPVMTAAGLLCAVLGGYLFWQHRQEQEMERQRAEAALARAKAQAAIPSPLLITPMPNNWLSACGQVISGLPLSESGWSLDQVACLSDGVNAHWVRSAGAIVSHRPQGSVSPNGDAVDQSIPLATLEAGRDDAIPLNEAKIRLQAWAQAAGFTLVIDELPPPLPGAQPANPDVPPQPPQAMVTLDLHVSPFGMDLSQIPGLRLTKLSTVSGIWRLEGTLYGR